MRYLEPKFSVGSPGTQAYADAWDRIFAKPAKVQESQGERTDAPTAGSACVPTAEGAVGEAIQLELFNVGDGGGCLAMGRGEGRGYRNATPSNQNEGGVSGFPDLKAAGAAR